MASNDFERTVHNSRNFILEEQSPDYDISRVKKTCDAVAEEILACYRESSDHDKSMSVLLEKGARFLGTIQEGKDKAINMSREEEENGMLYIMLMGKIYVSLGKDFFSGETTRKCEELFCSFMKA